MRGWKYVSIALLTAITLAASSGAAAPALGASGPVRGGTLNVGVDSDFVTLDPAQSSALIDRQAMTNIYDTLVQWTQKATIIPDLATSWKISNKGLTYSLMLRHGVVFQDNTPFNAQAVLFNFQRMMNKANASPRYSSLTLVKSVSAVGQYEVVFQLKSPFSPFLAVLAGRAGMMVSPAAANKYGKQFGNNPVGTGPFEFVKWVKGSYLQLKANPHYWVKGKPLLSQVIYHPITDPSVELSALKTGQVQIIDTIAAKDAASVKADHSLVYQQLPGLGYTEINLNTSAAPFNNVHLRRALNYAINRAAINKVIYYGLATPAYGQFPPTSWAYDPHLKIPYSVKLAKQQLAAGGMPKGYTFTMYGDNDPVTTEELQAIQAQLAVVGITMKIQLMDFGTLLSHDISSSFQGLVLGWSGRLDPDLNSYAFDVTGGSLNTTKFSNKTLDSVMNQARVGQTIADRRNNYWDAAKLLIEDAPYIMLVFPPEIKVMSPRLQGFVHFPDGLMRFTSVWLKP